MSLVRNPDGEEAFDYHLKRALKWFTGICPPATWSEVVFYEGEPLDHTTIPAHLLFTPDNYRQRFCELLEDGHSWINLHISGVLDGLLILSVEWPSYENNIPREYVSVNLSGPRLNADGSPAWNLAGRLEICG